MGLRYRIGMRAVKTVVAVVICLTTAQLLGFENEIDGVQAALAAVICMKSSLQNTLRTGIDRTIGTIFGSVIGVVFLLLSTMLPPYLRSVLVIVGSLMIIYLCNVLRLQASVPISIVVFLIILVAEHDIPPVYYGLARLGETVFGIFVAYMTNRFLDFRRYMKHTAPVEQDVTSGLRPAREDDIGAIMQIWLRASIAAHPFISEQHWHDSYDDMRLTFKSAPQIMVYVEDSRVRGFLALSSESEIIGIYVAPEMQRIGVGSALMGSAKEQHACLSMRVIKRNDSAVKFMLNRGFSLSEETDTEYLMQWSDKNKKIICDAAAQS